MRVQVFGRGDSRDTQKALRFFKERRVEVSFVDVSVRAPAPAELRRFAAKLGTRAMVDEDGRAYRDQGLAYLRMDDGELLARVAADARLLRLPLVRLDDTVTAGPAEAAWRAWLAGADQ